MGATLQLRGCNFTIGRSFRSAQEDGLNAMVDGVPITRVQGSNRFGHVVRERYAKLLGMRVLSDVKQRKDTGKPQEVWKRNGKDTITAVKRARREALKEASPIKEMC